MALSLYDITVPGMTRGLQTLIVILEKARVHATETGIAEAELLEARLAPDMLTVVGQVQRASDTAKFAAVRLGQVDNLSMADTEASFDDLRARLEATIDFLKAAPTDGFVGREQAEIIVTFPGGQQIFKGQDYALGFVLPNFYFHLTTAYDILRFKGVPVGKRDYLGGN